jgi:endonuclease YncB( thermonuclease family)
MKKQIALGLLLVTLISASVQEFSGKAVAISDGDNLTVLQDNAQVKTRFHGIDWPEKAQPFGTKAKQYTSELAFGKVVTVFALDKYRYGRTVGVGGCR